MPPRPTARERVRAELTREITDVARARLAADGAAALSLRAVARELGMVSSAIYRYFASRDELLTALIIEGYDALGAAVEQADAACAREDYPARWRAARPGGLPRRLAGAGRRGPGLGPGPPARVRPALRLTRARLPGPARHHRPGRPVRRGVRPPGQRRLRRRRADPAGSGRPSTAPAGPGPGPAPRRDHAGRPGRGHRGRPHRLGRR